MIVLGIETSCDETALALIETRGTAAGGDFQCRVIQSLVHSQAELHSAYGGVFPTLAKREHSKNLIPLLHKLLAETAPALPARTAGGAKTPEIPIGEFAGAVEKFREEFGAQNPELVEAFGHGDFLRSIPPIDLIAVTEGPGLEPALWTGIVCARMLSSLWDIPVRPINHMEGHIVGSLLREDQAYGTWQTLHPLELPALALLLSGGHTELVRIDALGGPYEIIGQTKDDAVGEAFDKAARLLGLPYPGGPHMAMLAHQAWEEKVSAPLNPDGSPLRLPRPMISSKDLDFSFSGLKTAVLYAVRAEEKRAGAPLSDAFKKGLAREFEQAVTETLDAKLRAAIDLTAARTLVVGGGVSANHVLRKRFQETAAEYAARVYMPSRHLSGDNALMIALAGALEAQNELSGAKKPARGRALSADGTKRLS